MSNFIRIFICLNFLFSCSFLEKRKSHYDYLKRGISKTEVLKRSGNPIKTDLARNSEDILIYNYCEAPFWKDIAFGILTLGIYATSCDLSLIEMTVIFKDESLVALYDNTNATERARRRARVGNAFKAMSDRKSIDKKSYTDNRPLESTCITQGNKTVCKTEKQGLNPDIYNQ